MIMPLGDDMPDLPPAEPARVLGGFDFRGAHMPSGHSVASVSEVSMIVPEGPALLYVHQDHATGMCTVTRVDHSPIMNVGTPSNTGRERALCRALLVHALHLLDEAEGTTRD